MQADARGVPYWPDSSPMESKSTCTQVFGKGDGENDSSDFRLEEIGGKMGRGFIGLG